jgi:hypothetical protein
MLQGRSADRERARVAAAQRDDILASLAGGVTTLRERASELHAAVWKRRLNKPLEVPQPRPRMGGPPDDPQFARMEGEVERLRRDFVIAASEIAVHCTRLEFIEPAMLPLSEQLGAAVTRLSAHIGAPDEEFRMRLEDVSSTSLAMNRKRNEIAAAGAREGPSLRRRRARVR